jgi:hypothetical protein
MGGTVANIEKHLKNPMEQIDQADFSGVPTCARAAHLIGRYIKNHQDVGRGRVSAEGRPRPVILRLEDVRATPRNLERIRERVRLLNRMLADSGTPFRLRIV